MTMPTLKFKTLVNFPAQVQGQNGITVIKTAGVYYVGNNYAAFTPAGPIPADASVLLYSPTNNSYAIGPVTTIAGAGSSFLNITNPTSQQLLQYDSGTSKFINRNQADLHTQSITSGTSVAIDRSLGEIVSLSLTATVSTFTVSNWPVSGTLGKITIFISNTGAFNIAAWPAGTIWPGGVIPTITSGSGKRDLIILTSVDGGVTISGAVAGQDFH